MKDVLICCTDAEGSQLEWLAKALLDTGWSVNFMHKGSRGVASANCVIAVWSPHSVGDAWLTARAKTAAKHRRLVSVRLGGARPPRGLHSEQVIDLSEWPARGADRAINSLLGSVDAVANGVAQRDDAGEDSKPWFAIGVLVLLLVGGFVLYEMSGVDAPGGSRTSNTFDNSDASARATDQAAAAAHALEKAAADRNANDRGTNEGDGAPADKPAAVMSDAARVGAQALSQLLAQVDGPTGDLDAVRRSAAEALALDPQQPQARAAMAVVTGLGDLKWQEAAQYLDADSATSSDAALADVVSRYRLMIGQSTGPVAAGTSNAQLCGVADDTAFVQAVTRMSAAERVALLRFGCVVERIGGSAEVRAQLGIG